MSTFLLVRLNGWQQNRKKRRQVDSEMQIKKKRLINEIVCECNEVVVFSECLAASMSDQPRAHTR